MVFEKCLDLADHPGLLIVKKSDMFTHHYIPRTEVDDVDDGTTSICMVRS